MDGVNVTEGIDLSNIDLSKCEVVDRGDTATEYKISDGALGVELGFDITFVAPNNPNGDLKLIGQVNSRSSGMEGPTWNEIYDVLLENNSSAIVVKLEPASSISSTTSRANYADSNMQALSLVGEIFGVNEAKVVGSSNGSIFACDIGAASATGDYGVKVTEVVWSDYANPDGKNLDSQFAAMAEGGVTFVGITDPNIHEGAGTGKALKDCNKMGGKTKGFFFGGSGDHDPTCKQAALAVIGIPTGRKFVEYGEYINGELVRVPYESSVLTDDDVISADYRFVNDGVSTLVSCINSSSIISLNNVGLQTSGSAAFQAVNTVFNNYANTSINFLESLGVTCGNIITMSKSLVALDKSLAEMALNEASSSLDDIVLTDINDFYMGLPSFDILSSFKDDGGTLKITKEGLLEAMSDSNIVLSSIATDIEDTQRLKKELDSFMMKSNGFLTGPAWDKMRIKISEYSETCSKKIEYAHNMVTSIKDSMQKLLDHMGEFDVLDMDQVDEISASIESLKSQISILESLIASTPDTEPIYGIDPETGEYGEIGEISHVEEKRNWQDTVDLCKEVQAVLEENLQKLNELPALDEQAADEIISESSEKIDTPDAEKMDISSSTVSSGETDYEEETDYEDDSYLDDFEFPSQDTEDDVSTDESNQTNFITSDVDNGEGTETYTESSDLGTVSQTTDDSSTEEHNS